MTNLANWQDIDDALGGDYDGSLSGLCIMSLSFDFSHNVPPYSYSNSNNNNNNNLACSSADTNNNNNHNSIANSNQSRNQHLNESMLSNGISLKALPSCNSSGNLPNNVANHTNNSFTKQLNSNATDTGKGAEFGEQEQNHYQSSKCQSRCMTDRNLDCQSQSSSPNNQQESTEEQVAIGRDNESPASSTSNQALSSPSEPSNSLSNSVSRTSSPELSNPTTNSSREPSPHLEPQSPSDMSYHNSQRVATSKSDECQVLANVQHKTSSIRQPNLKEPSFTTSVVTTTAPMHFKGLHHSFSLKQIPLSPYHQFSNSSLNHDFYDKYLSGSTSFRSAKEISHIYDYHESHQPLLTPLIGIERTQDLLSLKLPGVNCDENESQKFSRNDWTFDDSKNDVETNANISSNNKSKNNRINNNNSNHPNNFDHSNSSHNQNANDDTGVKKKDSTTFEEHLPKGFPFNYKSNSLSSSQQQKGESSKTKHTQERSHNLNLSFSSIRSFCSDHSENYENDFAREKQSCSRNKNDSHNEVADEQNGSAYQQYQGQESMFGIDSSKQKFQYVLSAPTSSAAKLNEDTMTYLNQGQAYEIKLENLTDMSEAKKGFMCSIINIGFHERHMQQEENELWQHWSQQHPNERIFSVDMKLSYNVFGVESDGLNKCEFLWDSSKAAGVFIRINSISTFFSPKRHGGASGIPLRLSIETFSYNSKTHDSYFISASSCRIKVFKPKGAERKIRSDKEKIAKKPTCEQVKYRRPTDYTIFKECSLNSLHPTADGSLDFYRHSHGHFASKQVAITPVTSQANNIQSANLTVNQTDEAEDMNSASHHQQSGHNNSAELSQPQQNLISNQSPSLEQNSRPQLHHSSNDSNGSSHTINSNRDYQEQAVIRMSGNSTVSMNRGTPIVSIAANRRSSAGSNQHLGLSSLPIQNNADVAARSASVLLPTNSSNHHQSTMHPYYAQSLSAPYLPPSHNYNIMANPSSLSLTQACNSNFHRTSSFTSVCKTNNQERPNNNLIPNHSNFESSLPNNKNTVFKTASTLAISSPNNCQWMPQEDQVQCQGTASFDDIQNRTANLSSDISSHYIPKDSNFYDHHPHHMFHTTNSSQLLTKQRPLPIASQTSQNQQLSHCSKHTNEDHCTPKHGNNAPVQNTNYSAWNSSSSQQSNYAQNNTPNTCDDFGYSMSTPGSINSNNNSSANNQYCDYANQRSGLATKLRTSNDASKPSTELIKYIPHSSQLITPKHSMENMLNHQSYENHPYNNQYLGEQNFQKSNYYKSMHHFDYNSNNNAKNITKPPASNSQLADDLAIRFKCDNVHQSLSHNISLKSNCTELHSWLNANRFGFLIRTFNNFSGSDILRLSKSELIQIAGLIDGIRLYNCLHNQPISPQRTIYIRHKLNSNFHSIYLFEVTLRELVRNMESLFAGIIELTKIEKFSDKSNGKSTKSLSKIQASGQRMQSSSGSDSQSSFNCQTSIDKDVDNIIYRNSYCNDNNAHENNSNTSNNQQIEASIKKQKTHHNNTNLRSQVISRLLIEGISPVKILATDQVVLMLKNDSVWNISFANDGEKLEACLTKCQSATSFDDGKT